jgi:hypothetical protein
MIRDYIASARGSYFYQLMSLLESPYVVFSLLGIAALYVMYVVRQVITPKRLPHSTVSQLSPIARTVPLVIVCLVIFKVITVLL